MRTRSILALALAGIIAGAAHQAIAMCGDVTGDGMLTAGDALAVLRGAVGDHPDMHCEPMCDLCGGPTTTTGGGPTTTLGGGLTTTTLPGGLFRLHVAIDGMMWDGMMHNGHGYVTSNPAGIDCGQDCSENYAAGQNVTLTAVADSDSYFVGWMGDVPFECMYNDHPCTVAMTRDHNVWAIFVDHGYGGPTTTLGGGPTTTLPGGEFRLHVSVNGMMSGGMMNNGHGYVTSNPAGINCGQDCNEDFAAGQSVTLTAVPDSDSYFRGWGGDVPAQCMYNDQSCTLTMSRDRNVWAVFIGNHGGGCCM